MTIAPDKIRTTIVISKSDKDALEKLALADDRSVNYLINKAIKEYLDKEKANDRFLVQKLTGNESFEKAKEQTKANCEKLKKQTGKK